MLQVEEGPFSLRDVAPGKLPCWRIAQTHAHSGSTDWICGFKNEYIELGRVHGWQSRKSERREGGLIRTFYVHVWNSQRTNIFKGSTLKKKEKNVLLTDILKKQVKRLILLIFKVYRVWHDWISHHLFKTASISF